MKMFLLIKAIPILAIGFASHDFKENTALSTQGLSEFYSHCERDVNGPEPVYTTEVIVADVVGPGCYTMQLSIYATYPNGQRLLVHSAMLQSGYGCGPFGGDKVLNAKTYSLQSGPEYILRDDNLNGPIEDFIAQNEDLYQRFIIQKEQLLATKQ